MKRRLIYFIYNLDRAFCSLIFGTSQETISSMCGRRSDKFSKFLHKWLDKWQPYHVEKAMKHADSLDKVDDGIEQ